MAGRKLSMAPGELRNFILTWAGKKTLYEMHQETGINAGTISNYASEMNVSLEVEDKKKKREALINAITEYHEVMTAGEIAIMLQVPRASVFYRGWKMGISFKPDLGTVTAEPIQRTKERVFNPYRHENWLI